MGENRVVIYSNGIADFQRCYTVSAAGQQRISIPVRRDHLADVLGSFNVYGNVKLESPPTFRPSNELEGNISINPQKVLEDLATGLSGAKVRVQRAGGAIEGVLVGLHQEEEATAGEPIHPQSIIVLADDGLRRCNLREIQSLKFLDEDVQKEIDKALQRNYQRIKPNSTFVELVLSAAEASADAIVQYTIPAAAWKISYRLRMGQGRTTELQGFAIVDNNTDEDWTDFYVSVVTGEPITFSTDLAETKTPQRQHVDLVSEMALGAVEVEAPMMVIAGGAGAAAADSLMEEAMERGSGKFRKSVLAKRSMAAAELKSAQTTTAEAREVGDFNIFESASAVSIPAKRSTVIPVFSVEIADAKSVLHYKHENHPERPYRSIDFVNQTTFSLGRGVCTVFEEAAYAGSCILPAMKPQEKRLLPHALETGVSVHRDQKRQRSKIVALRLSEGYCYTSTRQRRETHYHVKNSRDQTYDLILDHTYQLSEPDIAAQLVALRKEQPLEIATRLMDGVRYAISVVPSSEQVIKVVEGRIDQSSMELITTTKQYENLQVEWLEQNLVLSNGPLAQDKGVQECLRVQRDLDAKRQEIADAVAETERLAARQERLRQNIKAGGQDELSNRWRTELDEAEQAIKRIEEERLSTLREEEKNLRSKLKDALRSLSAEWSQDES